MSEDTITIRKDAVWKYSTFILLGVLVVVAIISFSGDSPTITGNVVANPPTLNPPLKVTASADDDARIGSPDAPVEIIEFSDFQCPYCSRAAPTVKQILDEYGDDVTFVYRDFPLESIHPMAMPSALAAECVREQGGDEAYFEYHDKLFANQQFLSNENLKQWAQEQGFDIDSCLDSQKYLDEVKKDLSDGQAAGGKGTPYFVINGVPVSGAVPFENFKQVIDAELNK